MMSNLKRTDLFSLDVGPIKDVHGDLSEGYSITNLRTGVREFETFVLAEAAAFLNTMEPATADFFSEATASEVLHS